MRKDEEEEARNQKERDADGSAHKGSKVLDQALIERIENEILQRKPQVRWDEVAGLEFQKSTIMELVIWPLKRPDLFRGVRAMGKGLLLFGPPGTGKTMIGKCIASQCDATFLSISAASLTSKWAGEGEKMVRALFEVARNNVPAVIFIDEIDSLLSQRSDTEHEGSRRIKTEFLVQLDGADTDKEERILLVAATNRPQELDDAARRRLERRLYIPLPETSARRTIILGAIADISHSLDSAQIDAICERCAGYSGADVSNLCREAALGPMRDLRGQDIQTIRVDELRSVTFEDFEKAFMLARPSVSPGDIKAYEEWDAIYGCRPQRS